MTTFVLRVAAQPAVIAPGSSHQVTVPAGRVVAAGIGSAMFDPAVFPAPDNFQPARGTSICTWASGRISALASTSPTRSSRRRFGKFCSYTASTCCRRAGAPWTTRADRFAESFKLGFEAS